MLREAERFVLAGHIRADGDCFGSEVALARVLSKLGKTVTIVNPDSPIAQFDYLRDGVELEVFAQALPSHDVVCLLDINELSRCGDMAGPLAEAPSRKIVIDHHPFHGEPWWNAAFVDVSASATGVLVWRIMRELGVEPDVHIATAVYTALVTDTGWFRYSNTDAETLSVASDLLELGVLPAEIFSRLYQRHATTEPQAIAALLQRVKYHADGRIAVVDQPLRAGPLGNLGDSDPVLDILRSVGTVEVVLYLKELEPGLCKLSARSKSDFDVNLLARGFGGGGHRKASGATVRGGLDETCEAMVSAALAQFESMSSTAAGTREERPK